MINPVFLHSSARSSSATGGLSIPGNQEVRVSISSPIYTRLGQNVIKYYSFSVVQAIQSVDLYTCLNTGEEVSCAALDTNWTEIINFQAKC